MTGPAAPLATLADLEARTQRALLGTPEQGRAAASLLDASALVRAELPPALLTPAAPPVVVTIVCQAAARALRNPEGYTSETIGQYGYRYGDATVTGVYLTTDERAVLRRIARRSGLRSTRTPYTAGGHVSAPDTVPVLYAGGQLGEPMPWTFLTDSTGQEASSVPPAPADGHHPG
ncbi:MAG: hypothetical protein ABIQ18_00470 [Umezawaea sp.]